MTIRKISLIILLLLVSKCIYADPDWHLKRDDDGIKVFTASTPNSDFKSIKVECTINARFSQLVAFLLDVDKQAGWVYNSKSTHLIKKIAPGECIFYSEVSVPWPCNNRDYVAHFTIKQQSPTLVTIDSHTEPDLVPVKDGIVRVRHSEAHWDVIALSPDELKVIYTVQFDPAGAIPAWLTNLFVTKGPYETFENLRKGITAAEYQHASLSFIKDP